MQETEQRGIHTQNTSQPTEAHRQEQQILKVSAPSRWTNYNVGCERRGADDDLFYGAIKTNVNSL